LRPSNEKIEDYIFLEEIIEVGKIKDLAMEFLFEEGK